MVVSFVVYRQLDTGIKPEEVLQASFNRGVGGLGFLAAFPLPLPGLSTNATGQVVLLQATHLVSFKKQVTWHLETLHSLLLLCVYKITYQALRGDSQLRCGIDSVSNHSKNIIP